VIEVKSGTTREPGLFVIWEKGRSIQDRILEDLADHFHVNRVTEFHWTPSMIWANYQRFYSDTHIRGSAHARNKGSGPFLAVNVVVDSPTYDRRMTRNRGMRLVNNKMFDAKTRYREWTDGYAIHCGENLAENVRDAYMLFGPESDTWEDCELREWNGSIDILNQDPVGAHGWKSFEELFSTLNRAINYVLIYYGPYEEAMDGIPSGHSIDIITSNYNDAHAILHNGSRIPSPLKYGGPVKTRVGKELVKLNLRYPGDGLFDEAWANKILDERVLDVQGFYRPRKDEFYWLMAHHAVTARSRIDRCSLEESRSVAAAQYVFTEADLPANDAHLKSLLIKQLIDRGIRHSKNGTRFGMAINIVISAFMQKFHMLAAQFRTSYFAVRDTALEKLPILTALKQSIKILASRRQRV
jgi:hypothetical protein